MKVKKSSGKLLRLAKLFGLMVVLFCLGVGHSYAYKIEIDENKWVDFKIRGQLAYHNLDERGGEQDYRQNYFEPTEAEFYATGQLTPLFQFFTQWEANYQELDLSGKEKSEGDVTIKETGVLMPFAPEFKVRFGRIRTPISRYHQRSDYKKLIPTDHFYRYDIYGLFKERSGDFKLGFNKTVLNIRQPGVLFFGDTQEGMFRYYGGIYNQTDNNHKDFRYTARLVFTPTMLGFEPESSLKGTRGDTYLGKKDILTIGLGYAKGKISSEEFYNLEVGPTLDNEIYALDLTVEKKCGPIVPNFGAGYIKAEESHLNSRIKPEDSEFWYAQGQLLYDAVVGIGKPAIAVRFERMDADQGYQNEAVKSDRLSVSINYYIKGFDAMVALCLDNLSYKDGAEDYLKAENKEDSVTDGSLFLQFVF